MNSDREQMVAEIVARLETAWNAGDGAAFAQPFAEDADFVNIRADHFRTREVIARGHQGIFDTVYKASVVRYRLASVREIAKGVLLAHVTATLKVPTGPLAGEHDALYSLVLVQNGSDWRIAAFHNTLVAR
jgi:uncharacterized protein (TIGR02246 family)